MKFFIIAFFSSLKILTNVTRHHSPVMITHSATTCLAVSVAGANQVSLVMVSPAQVRAVDMHCNSYGLSIRFSDKTVTASMMPYLQHLLLVEDLSSIISAIKQTLLFSLNSPVCLSVCLSVCLWSTLDSDILLSCGIRKIIKQIGRQWVE